jgi:hypothetical protein
MRRLILAAAILSVAACTTPKVREVTVTKEVPVPHYQPCPKAEDVPVLPKRVAEEHPTLPKQADGTEDWKAISRILSAKVLELFGYGEQADALLTECARPR